MEDILGTKLVAPPLRSDFIIRERLFGKLNSGFDRGVPVFLITAPPGYGKTILVSSWLRSSSKRHTWLSLDEKDNNPYSFFRYLIAALRKINRNIGQAAVNLLAGSHTPSFDMIMNTLINDIIDSAGEFILVLEDVHVLSSEYLTESVKYLIQHIPEALRLILISRETLPIPLTQLRSSRKIMEIDQADLRFDTDECRAFLNNMVDGRLPSHMAEQLNSYLEGWPAGLQLAGLSFLSDEMNSEEMIERFASSNRYIDEYLMNEVLNKIDAEKRDFMIKTSLLERFNASLCDFIIGSSDSSRILEDLNRKNLFLMALDEDREWYRYHHFFAGLLRSEVKDGDKALIRHRASLWFERHDLIIEAMEYASLCGDTLRIEKLLSNAAADLFFRGESHTFLKYLSVLSEDQIRSNAVLATYRVWTMYSKGYLSECFMLMDQLKSSDILNRDPLYHGSFLILNVILLIQKRDRNALETAKEALKLVTDKNQAIEIFTRIIMGNAQLVFEDTDAALDTFRHAFELSKKGTYQFNFISSFCRYTDVLILAGKRNEALECCRILLDEYVDDWGRVLPVAKSAYLALGLAYYESGDFELAKAYLDNAILFFKPAGLVNFLSEAEYRLAKMLYYQGKKEEARKLIEDIIDATRNANQSWILQLMDMLKAEFALLEGRSDEAATLLNLDDADLHNVLDERVFMLKIRILTAQRRISEAEELLDYVEEYVKKTKHLSYSIHINIRRSVICGLQGFKKEAEQYMVQALLSAREGFYVQAFIEDYPVTRELLIKNKSIAPKLVARIEEHAENIFHVGRKDTVAKKVTFNKEFLIEGLSNREKEILVLIDQGLTNKEIAEKLFITIGTTKWHINNIFSKFGVTTRSKAIVCARMLKILPS